VQALRADITAIRRHKLRLAPFVFPHLFAVACYRLSVALRSRHQGHLARIICAISQTLTGAEINPDAQIGPGLLLDHTHGIVVGGGVVAGQRLRLGPGALLGSSFNDPTSQRPTHGYPVIGDDVTLLAKASVIGAVTVGDRAVIGAHALVIDDVPADAVARGVPAKMYPQR